MTSAFNKDLFLQTTVVGANVTKMEVCPVHDAALAMIDSIDVDSFQGQKDPSKTFFKLAVNWKIEEQSLIDALPGRDKITIKQDIFLDFTDSGALDMGKDKNVGLGRLREAVNQNAPDKPWAPPMLVGQIARVKIEHELVKGETYARVTGVAKA